MACLEESTRIIQLKVRLLGLSPMIWRRVLVSEPVSPRELHGILQVSMGWKGIHLYYFDIYAVHYSAFELDSESPDLLFSTFRFRERQRFAYLYDMGNYWEHEVRLEKLLEREPFLQTTFYRQPVNKSFRAGRHLQMMHQQLM